MNQILGKYKAYAFQRPIYGFWRGHFMSYLTRASTDKKLSGRHDVDKLSLRPPNQFKGEAVSLSLCRYINPRSEDEKLDVHCSTCREPWDVDHLWHEAIFETDLTNEEAEAWQELPQEQKLNTRYRQKFSDAGWEFGKSVINVIRCPCCPADAQTDPERLAIKAALEDVLGDDEDGLAITLEDYCL